MKIKITQFPGGLCPLQEPMTFSGTRLSLAFAQKQALALGRPGVVKVKVNVFVRWLLDH